MPQMTAIDPSQIITIQTARLGWPFVLCGIFMVGLGATIIPLALQEGGQGFIIGIALICVAFGLLMFYGVWKTNFSAPSAVISLSPDGLRVHAGMSGLIPWSDVEEARDITIGGRVAVQYLQILLVPGTSEQLEASSLNRLTRKIDEATGFEGLMFAYSQLALPVSDAVDLIHLYKSTHASGIAAAPDESH